MLYLPPPAFPARLTAFFSPSFSPSVTRRTPAWSLGARPLRRHQQMALIPSTRSPAGSLFSFLPPPLLACAPRNMVYGLYRSQSRAIDQTPEPVPRPVFLFFLPFFFFPVAECVRAGAVAPVRNSAWKLRLLLSPGLLSFPLLLFLLLPVFLPSSRFFSLRRAVRVLQRGGGFG